jgi:hypothetical protein
MLVGTVVLTELIASGGREEARRESTVALSRYATGSER